MRALDAIAPGRAHRRRNSTLTPRGGAGKYSPAAASSTCASCGDGDGDTSSQVLVWVRMERARREGACDGAGGCGGIRERCISERESWEGVYAHTHATIHEAIHEAIHATIHAA